MSFKIIIAKKIAIKKILNILQYLFFLGLGIFLVWWSIHQIPDKEFDGFKKALTTANYWLIIPVFLMLSASHLIRALRWKLLMQPMGYTPSLPNTFFAVMIGYLANLAVPRLGEVLKCTILSKYEKVPADKIVGTIVAERAFDVICLLIVFVLAFIFQFNEMMDAFEQLKHFLAIKPKDENDSRIYFYIKIGLAILLCLFIIWVVVSKKWKIFIAKAKNILKGIIEGLSSALKLQQKNKFLFYSASIWMLYLVGTWIGLYATKGTEAGLPVALSCLALASIGMIITPGGVGAYAILLAYVLVENKIAYPLGIANGTLQWFAQCIIVLVVGFVCLILLPIYNKNKKLLKRN